MKELASFFENRVWTFETTQRSRSQQNYERLHATQMGHTARWLTLSKSSPGGAGLHRR